MEFIFPALTLGFLLTLLPVLIHLINMLRHQRVKWAAMEFLLKSYKKHRRWVWLKQLLLLLARMAAIALLVMMLAQWNPAASWLQQFGGKVTHHYVLLDDSFSMGEQVGGASAFERGLKAIGQIAAEAANTAENQQRFTLIRFSRAAHHSGPDQVVLAEQVADLNNEVVDAEFDLRLEERRRLLELSELAVGPAPVLNVIRQLVADAGEEQNQIYLVSDFRAKEWESPGELRTTLRQVEEAGAELHFISCSRGGQPNLAITDVAAAGETRAAGVPLFVNVSVKNYGPNPVKQVQLKVRTQQFDPVIEEASSPGKLVQPTQDLPVEIIESIAPGETVTQRVQVFFAKSGRHVISAELPEDSIPADNRRWCVVEFADGEPVLVVDGHPDKRNAYFLNSIFQPGGRANTGIMPQVEEATFLEESPAFALQSFAAIYLLDVPRLGQRAIANLEQYAQRGGGIAVFLGPQTSVEFANGQLYREGKGLLPLPLGPDALLLPPTVEETPDINIEGSSHPLFRELLLGRNPIIRMVKVDRYVQADAKWEASEDSPANVIAQLHNGAPLIVEQKFGDGRVVAFLTTFAPDWNDLALGPNVLLALKLQSYLAANTRRDETRPVGQPLDVAAKSNDYRPEVSFATPGPAEGQIVIEQRADKENEEAELLVAGIGHEVNERGARATDRSGVYEAWLSPVEGRKFDVQRFALNVDPQEGNLSQPTTQQLLAGLDPVKPTFRHTDEFDYQFAAAASFNPNLWIMGVLILLLLGEQLLAYLISYHPARGGAR